MPETIKNNTLVLQPFTENDFDQLIQWINTKDMLTNWAGSLFNFPLTNKSLQWYIKKTNDLANSDAFVYKVVDEAQQLTIGHISLGSISRKNRSGRISRVLVGHDAYKGKGLCTTLIRLILEVGFQQLNLHRISLGVYTDNTSAFNCYKKAGFVVEGISRDVLFWKDNFRSLAEMSMLEDEWRSLQ